MRAFALMLVVLVALATPSLAQQTLTGYTGRVKLQGSVSGTTTATIRAYVNGLQVAETETSPTGSYDITFELDGAVDQTAVLWFIPSDPGGVPEIIIFKESSSARRNGIWSPCLTRLKPTDVIVHDVQIVDQKTLFQNLEESDCWEQ